jgi:hypothetical protein
MESDMQDPRHYLRRAGNITVASCFGRYMGVNIEKVFVNIPIMGHSFDECRKRNFTLIRSLFTNIWDHRIRIWGDNMYLIDSEGIQHSQETHDLHIYRQATEVIVSGKRNVAYDFASHTGELEGKAKTRGWLWFPALPPGIHPHRLIFNFNIFSPGDTSGLVEDQETLEIAFDFQFRKLLADSKNFVTLEAGEFRRL